MKILVIASGDPNGISYEVIVKSLAELKTSCTKITKSSILSSIIIFGSKKVYQKTISQLNCKLKINLLNTNMTFNKDSINLFDLDESSELEVLSSSSALFAGKVAYESLKSSLKFIKENPSSALLTAPVNKKRIQTIEGLDNNFTGHTNFLAKYFNQPTTVMMFVCSDFKIIPLTHHIALSKVPQAITFDIMFEQMNIVAKFLSNENQQHKKFKFAQLALNPHAGEEGKLGLEEIEIIKPAILKINKQTDLYEVFGPYPADGFFAKKHHKVYDAVFATYHDQALIPAKILGGNKIINQTLGLNIIRTSPTHGTAEDIANDYKADHTNMKHTILTTLDLMKL